MEEARVVYEAAEIALNKFQAVKPEDQTPVLRSQLDQLNTKIAEMRTLYTDEHPGLKELVLEADLKSRELDRKMALLANEQKEDFEKFVHGSEVPKGGFHFLK